MDAPRDPNIYDAGTETRGIAGFDSWRQRVGDGAGSRRIGTSVWDVPPGQGAYPFHFHYVEEEQIVVIEGRPLLRGPDGWRRLERGAVVAFLPGEAGAHQIHNDTAEPVKFLAISTSGEPDIVHYPELGAGGKIGVFERPPGEGKLFKLFPLSAETPYDEGDIPLPDPPAGIP